jgi:hypothetical protein
MSTDPYVAARIEDKPRQKQNLAPGVSYPPARPWRAGRPGELGVGQPRGPLFGAPGPDIGYALTLVERARDRVALAPHEHWADAAAVIGEVAMKRAASFGRAPVMDDVECARLALGYQGGCEPDFAKWRVLAVAGAHESYPRRRAICDAIDLDTLRRPPRELEQRIGEVRDAIRAATEVRAGMSAATEVQVSET